MMKQIHMTLPNLFTFMYIIFSIFTLTMYRYMVQVKTEMTSQLYISAGDVAYRGRKLTPSDVLRWISGADRVPAEGFDMAPRIHFNHMEQQRYPDVNTCTCDVTMYTSHPDITNSAKSTDFFLSCIVASDFFGKW